MLTELTFAILKYGFLVLLWIFVACTVRSLYRDIETLSPRKSRAHRRKERAARKAVESPAPVAAAAPSASAATNAKPTLLVIIDGPLAGSSVPLAGNTITLGRSASNTVVLDDEFVSSHHARVYTDPATGRWAIEDLGSTNGSFHNGKRVQRAVAQAGDEIGFDTLRFQLLELGQEGAHAMPSPRAGMPRWLWPVAAVVVIAAVVFALR